MGGFKVNKIIVTVLLIATCDFIHGANIAFFFGIASYSHCITVWPLVENLAANGHNVTYISAFPPKKPNPKVRELQPKSMVDWVAEWGKEEVGDIFANRRAGKTEWFDIPKYGEMLCDKILSDKHFVEWIEKTPVDLVVMDSLFYECGYAIVYKHKAKTMIFGTSTLLPWHYDSFGLPAETSWIPDLAKHFPQNMTFMEKVYTTIFPVYWDIVREWQYFPNLEKIIKTKLGLDINLREVERQTSLVLVNTYFAEEYARSLPPSIVPIGGMHCKEKTEPLPKNMEEFITKPGTKAFVYISFGSQVQISKSPPETQKAFFNTLKKLSDIQFIWKWDGEVPDISLPNVLFVKWAPQQDILAHPKLKIFITHSGLLSIQEAVYRGVPLISLPVAAEQDYNAERIHRMEHGIRLEITEITENQLESAITKILNDPKYSRNMKLLSKRFKDRPMTPAETALWWTEYVLRHEDTSFLSPMAIHQKWYQRRLLDVWAFIAVVLILFVSTTTYILIQLIKCTLLKKTSKNLRTNKKVKAN